MNRDAAVAFLRGEADEAPALPPAHALPSVWEACFPLRAQRDRARAALRGSFPGLARSGWTVEVDAAGLRSSVVVPPDSLWGAVLPVCALVDAERRRLGRRVLVGVAGAGGAGKSTLACVLRAAMGAAFPACAAEVAGMDGWHLAGDELRRRGAERDKGRPHTFDLDAFAADLARARGGGAPLLLPAYDRALHEPVPGAARVPASCRALLVEGLFVSWHEPARRFLDLVVHLDAPFQLCLERLLARQAAAGRDPAAAAAHADRVDRPNHALVAAAARHAHVVLAHGLGARCAAVPARLPPCVEEDLLRRARGEGGGAVLVRRPAVVHRSTYVGAGVLGDNGGPGAGGEDARGYLPVEWWVASCTRAENPKEASYREGVSAIALGSGDDDDVVGLDRAADALLGRAWRVAWPLVKLLDIGGAPVRPDFGGGGGDAPPEERPPIPAHVHSGRIVDGRAVGKGKYEAYYYPTSADDDPEEEPPTLRVGVRDGVTREQLVAGVGRFGRDDSVYALLNAYPARAGDGWSVPPGVVHAPAPRLTLEVQRPQDDFNLLSWQMGRRLEGDELRRQRCECVHRGLADDADVVDRLVRLEEPGVGADEFARRYARPPVPLTAGEWGRTHRIFFDIFCGVRASVRPGRAVSLEAAACGSAAGAPAMVVVWRGSGSVCGNAVSSDDPSRRELVVLPGHDVRLTCDAGSPELRAFVVYPLDESKAGGV